MFPKFQGNKLHLIAYLLQKSFVFFKPQKEIFNFLEKSKKSIGSQNAKSYKENLSEKYPTNGVFHILKKLKNFKIA